MKESRKHPYVPAAMCAVLLALCATSSGCLKSVGAPEPGMSVAEQTKAILESVQPASKSDLDRIAAAIESQAEATKAQAAVMELAIKSRDDEPTPEFARFQRSPDPAPEPETPHADPSDPDAAVPESVAPSGDPVVAAIHALRDSIREEQAETRRLIAERNAVPERPAPAPPERIARTGLDEFGDDGLVGFTGAVIYVGEPAAVDVGNSNCVPCNALVVRIRAYPTDPRWLVSTNKNRHFWLRKSAANDVTPITVYYRDGREVGRFEGLPADMSAYIRMHPWYQGNMPQQQSGYPQFPPGQYQSANPVWNSQAIARSADCGGGGGGEFDPWPQAAAPTGRRLVCRGGRCWWE